VESGLESWPITLPQPLPVVPVPLLNGDPDVLLDLQQALIGVYDSSRYDLLLDYGKEPDVPLAATEAAWVDRLLKEKRCR
jgi:hypothetical protein